MDDIAKYSDKVIVMDDGKILMVGTAYEVFSQRELLSSRGLGMPCIMELASKYMRKNQSWQAFFRHERHEARAQKAHHGAQLLDRSLLSQVMGKQREDRIHLQVRNAKYYVPSNHLVMNS